MALDKNKISVKIDELFKTYVRNSERADVKWHEYYDGHIQKVYRDMAAALDAVSKESSNFKDRPLEDPRCLKPIPTTSFNVIGWLSGRKEFSLENFGPDVMSQIPFPKDNAVFD